MVGKYHLKLFPPQQKTDTTAQPEKSSSSPRVASVFVPPSVILSVCMWGLREGYRVKQCVWEWMEIFLSACVEGILRLFTNFYLQRKLSILLRIYCDCKVVDPYNHFPQDWPHGGIQRIGWLANQSRFLTKWLKRGRVHNLDLLKQELSTKNPAKKSTNIQKIKFWQAPNV
jgi:hypothetical protein